MEDYDIIPVRGHYEVYYKGKFFCSADFYGEAVEEIKKHNRQTFWRSMQKEKEDVNV